MIRRISTKWVLSALAAVILPFLAFAWYVDVQMAARTWDTVRYYLLTLVGETAERLNDEVRERELDIELWTTTTPLTQWTISAAGGEELSFRSTLRGGFNRFIQRSGVFDLILAVNAQGELVVSNDRDVRGAELPASVVAALERRDYERESWFQEAMQGRVALVDHHVSDLLPPRVPTSMPHPENYHVGFAVPVSDQLDPTQIVGVVYGLMNWNHIQNVVLRKVRPRIPLHDDADYPAGDGKDLYQSSYVWLWMSDADTIIAHPDKGLYAKKVSAPPVNLPQLVEAARSSEWGMYPEYSFLGRKKNAAYRHCLGPDKGGFGWVVGVGIDNEDIYAVVNKLRMLLWGTTALILAMIVPLAFWMARRTTRPIQTLMEHTRAVAGGNLDARVDVRSDDELGDLGRAFNQMTHELAENRTRLIKAEKDAAWREMARQVAHEIKNPLTPIRLSMNLLARAKQEHSPEFDAIFARTVELVDRQVDSMRTIAAEFSAFAGARKPTLEAFALEELMREVVDLHAGWAEEQHVELTSRLEHGLVFVDRHELRRVLINLVSNAFEAMPDGGRLEIVLERLPERRQLKIEIRDSGVGLSETVRARLFEPYFTTRSHGTGLGLAIAKRVVEEMNGTITLEPRSDASAGASAVRGTVARILLPEHMERT